MELFEKFLYQRGHNFYWLGTSCAVTPEVCGKVNCGFSVSIGVRLWR